MIGYVTLGSNDLAKAKTFYDGVLAGLGAKRGYTGERMQFWVTERGAPMLSVCRPYDGEDALGRQRRHGRPPGRVVGYGRRRPRQGHRPRRRRRRRPPGQRLDWFYGGYFRDLDGNKICVFKMT